MLAWQELAPLQVSGLSQSVFAALPQAVPDGLGDQLVANVPAEHCWQSFIGLPWPST